MRRNVTLDAAIAVVLFGCIPMTVRSIDANPYTIGIFRLTVATLAVAAFLAFRGELRRVPLRDAMRLATIGLFFFAHWLTLFFAIKASSASIAAIGQSTYGIHLLILSAMFTDHKLQLSDVVAVIAAAIGAILVVPSTDLGNDVTMGMLLAGISALLYASLPLLHQRWSHIPNMMRTLGQFGFAWLFFLLFAGRSDWRLGPKDWAGLLFLAIGVTVIGHSLWVRVTTHVAPRITSIIYYVNIPIAVLLGIVVLGEPLHPRAIAGGALIIAGSIFGLARRHLSAGASMT